MKKGIDLLMERACYVCSFRPVEIFLHDNAKNVVALEDFPDGLLVFLIKSMISFGIGHK
jgi:hypothetical protein